MPEDWLINECFGLDDDCLGFIPQPTLGVIVNYERLKKAEDKALGDPAVETTYYMKQTSALDNACGIIASLHCILNHPKDVVLKEGSILAKFWATA